MKWLDAATWPALLLIAMAASAQQLYKYTGKDGKVTYSDRVPRADEKAEPVVIDARANIVASPRPAASATKGVSAKPASGSAKEVEARDKARRQLRDEIDAAQKNLDAAKAALEGGRDAKPEEVQIVVRQGGNSVLQKPVYAERIAGLEQAVKAAEERLAKAEQNYRRNAPD